MTSPVVFFNALFNFGKRFEHLIWTNIQSHIRSVQGGGGGRLTMVTTAAVVELVGGRWAVTLAVDLQLASYRLRSARPD